MHIIVLDEADQINDYDLALNGVVVTGEESAPVVVAEFPRNLCYRCHRYVWRMPSVVKHSLEQCQELGYIVTMSADLREIVDAVVAYFVGTVKLEGLETFPSDHGEMIAVHVVVQQLFVVFVALAKTYWYGFLALH